MSHPNQSGALFDRGQRARRGSGAAPIHEHAIGEGQLPIIGLIRVNRPSGNQRYSMFPWLTASVLASTSVQEGDSIDELPSYLQAKYTI
jgi:hypothetical protein